LIRAVDSDCSVSSSERSLLASLLVVAMARNISYCTDIALSLMTTLIVDMNRVS
jgi:hypothetical protein